jgi:hypothetical protein
MSAESTPVLAGVIPSFEMFMSSWEKLARQNPRLRNVITIGLHWAYKYYGRMDRTKAYIIAMCECYYTLISMMVANINYSDQSDYPFILDQKALGS